MLHSNETTMKSSPHEVEEMIHHAILYALMPTMPVCIFGIDDDARIPGGYA